MNVLSAVRSSLYYSRCSYSGGDSLYLAVVFFVLASVAAALGMGGVAGMSMDITKWTVVVFIVLAVIALVL